MKGIKLLSAMALAGIISIGSASAQTQIQSQHETPYQMLHGFGKHTSSAAKYKSTKLRPYDGSASPLT